MAPLRHHRGGHCFSGHQGELAQPRPPIRLRSPLVAGRRPPCHFGFHPDVWNPLLFSAPTPKYASLSYFRTLQLTFVGFFFNLFLIGSTGGDAVRLFYLIRWFPQQKARATLSILLDRVFGVAALFGLALLFLPGTADRLRADPAFAPLASALPWLGPLGAFLLVLGFLLPTFLPNLPIPKKLPGRAILIDLIHGLRDTMHGGWNTVAAVLVAISVHLLSFLGATLLARALDLPISYSLAGLILVLIFSASALPISVSGHGVREGVMIFLFLHLGLGTDPESAIAYSILIYGLGLFWSLLGGLAYLTLRSPRSQP